MESIPSCEPNRVERVIIRTFKCYPSSYRAALKALAWSAPDRCWQSPDEAIYMLAGSRPQDDYPGTMERVRACLMSATAEFADLDCRAPRHEDWMSGSLESRLVSAFSANTGAECNFPAFWAADLLGAREGKTGADMALFVEVAEKYVVFVLQAKRTLHVISTGPARSVNITRRGSERDRETGELVEKDELWQLKKMQTLRSKFKAGVSAAYLLYDNSEMANREPVLPLVADLDKHYAQALETGHILLTSKVYDLATYAMYMLAERPAPASEHAELAAIADAVISSEIHRIFVVASGDNFVLRLQKAFRQHLGSRSIRFSVLSDQLPTMRPEKTPDSRTSPGMI